MTQTDRRFIEDSFPVKEVSEHSAKEKNIRHGHISTLHIWWARRPLAASRATAYAALVPFPEDPFQWNDRRNFIVNLCQWENSLNTTLLERARREIYAAHAERLSAELGQKVTAEDIAAGRYPPPRVLDPFSGGGSYPLEALRLGCEAHANDYNPVAVLILKATLEYPQRFGRPFPGMPEHLWRRKKGKASANGQLRLGLEEPTSPDAPPADFNPLLAAVKFWGDWVLTEARRELSAFYPQGGEGQTPVGYIWARTLPCQNPACGAEIPLMRQFWLAKKDKKHISLHPVAGQGRVDFEIVARGKDAPPDHYAPWPKGFDPEKGTVKGAVVTCPACGATIDAKTTRRLFREGKAGQRMVAVVYTPSPSLPLPGGGRKGGGRSGKAYRLPTPADLAAYYAAAAALQEKREQLRAAWGMEPVPDEPLPVMSGVFNAPIYGMDTWGKLFNPRQQLALLTFADAVRRAHAEMLAAGYPPAFAQAVATYLGITFNRLADKNANIVVYNVVGEKIEHVFGRQALPMVWDYTEVNPFTDVGWPNMLDWVLRTIDHLAHIPTQPTTQRTQIGADAREAHGFPENLSSRPPLPLEDPLTGAGGPGVRVTHASATRLPYPNAFFDAILTDPPYYNSVPYADLSDFFYVWLKRTVGHLYPDLFSTPLTPKSEEITEMAGWDPVRYPHKDKLFFEQRLAHAFREIQRVLKPGGVAVIVYAHKSTAGWETVINALLDSGLVVNAAWPLNTEMGSRLRANESAALASSIYIVARKAERQGVGLYHQVRAELRQHMERRLKRLWEEGIGGADFFIAAIGSGIEVFGRYEQVIDMEGNVIRADALLDEVRTLATDFAVRQILHNGFAAEISDRARFYVLWRWNFGEARVPFDEARKLAQSCGLDLSEEWARRGGMVKKEQEFVRLLGPHQRDLDDLAAGRDLIDVLHHALRLWEKSERSALIQRLAKSGYGASEAFYRVAQAISECLPLESKEKKLLDGLLTGRSRLQEEVRQARLL